MAGSGKWSHREPADHNILFGRPSMHPSESQRLRDAWLVEHGEMTRQEESDHVEPIPEPQLRATPVEDDALPGGAGKIVRAARKAGWTIQATRSRGPWLHSTHWTATGVYDLLLVRLRRGDERARAFWRTDAKGAWKFEHAWHWHTTHPSLEQIGSKALTERINHDPEA